MEFQVPIESYNKRIAFLDVVAVVAAANDDDNENAPSIQSYQNQQAITSLRKFCVT